MVDPALRARMPVGDAIKRDITCPSCGYNLRGLRVGDPCPECGTEIAVRRRRSRLDDNMVDAPMPYLKRLRLACWLLAAGAIGTVASLPYGLYHSDARFLVAAAAAALAWSAGVVIITRPRQSDAYQAHELRRERAQCRGWAVVTQACWLYAAGASGAVALLVPGLIASATSAGQAYSEPRWMEFMRVSASMAYAPAIIGIVCLCVWLADLADWASDVALADRLRDSAWGLCLGLPITLACTFTTAHVKSLPGPLSFLVWTGSILGALAFVSCAFLFFASILRLAGTTTWAVANSITGVDRDRRIAERRAGAMQATVDRQAVLPAMSPVSPASEAPVAKSDVTPRHARNENFRNRPKNLKSYDLAPEEGDEAS